MEGIFEVLAEFFLEIVFEIVAEIFIALFENIDVIAEKLNAPVKVSKPDEIIKLNIFD